MPHLSPIIWTTLYFMVWISFLILTSHFEFFYPSLKR